MSKVRVSVYCVLGHTQVALRRMRGKNWSNPEGTELPKCPSGVTFKNEAWKCSTQPQTYPKQWQFGTHSEKRCHPSVHTTAVNRGDQCSENNNWFLFFFPLHELLLASLITARDPHVQPASDWLNQTWGRIYIQYIVCLKKWGEWQQLKMAHLLSWAFAVVGGGGVWQGFFYGVV